MAIKIKHPGSLALAGLMAAQVMSAQALPLRAQTASGAGETFPFAMPDGSPGRAVISSAGHRGALLIPRAPDLSLADALARGGPPAAIMRADRPAASAASNRTAAAPPVPAASDLAEADVRAAVKAQLESRLATGELKAQWTEIEKVYAARGYAPLWRDASGWSSAAKSARAKAGQAADDGLNLTAISLPALEQNPKSAQEAAANDLGFTDAVVAYARQAAGSRIDPARLSKLISAHPQPADPADILARVSAAGDGAAGVLEDYNPPHEGYRALRAKLAELRHAASPAGEPIPAGPPLRVGMRDPRVKLVRARFGLGIAEPQSSDDILYDTQVADAVAGFQRTNGLPASGVLTPRTVARLSGGEPRRLENEIIANMERWRWMPRDLGRDRIEVDIAHYTLSLKRNGEIVHTARVVVGKPTNATPVFSNAMKFIVVNPSWYIPPSILKKEILPKLAADPGYLARLGYEMTVKHGQISVRQPPGERNALGHVKFMFPNDQSVYLHDTPSRGLFASAKRAFSHGCVRVDDPMALAAAVLQGPWSAARVKSLVGGKERTIPLPEPLPIHLEYFTASVGPDGRLDLREDIYGYDRDVERALGLHDPS